MEVGSNLFQFKFNSEFELDRVVRRGPWSFDNQVLMLRQCVKNLGIFSLSLNRMMSFIESE